MGGDASRHSHPFFNILFGLPSLLGFGKCCRVRESDVERARETKVLSLLRLNMLCQALCEVPRSRRFCEKYHAAPQMKGNDKISQRHLPAEAISPLFRPIPIPSPALFAFARGHSFISGHSSHALTTIAAAFNPAREGKPPPLVQTHPRVQATTSKTSLYLTYLTRPTTRSRRSQSQHKNLHETIWRTIGTFHNPPRPII